MLSWSKSPLRGASVEPVRVRLYGFLRMTRRRYLRQVFLALMLSAVLLGVWAWNWPGMRREILPDAPPTAERFLALMDALGWIILAAVLLQLIEAFFVLRRFRQLEAHPSSSLPSQLQPQSQSDPIQPPQSG